MKKFLCSFRAIRDDYHGAALRRMFANYSPPLIIFGMHRSGTSFLTRLLRANGGYFGCDLDTNSESKNFQEVNKKILAYHDLSWQHMRKFEDFVADPAKMRRAIRVLVRERHLLAPFFRDFGLAGVETPVEPLKINRSKKNRFILNFKAAGNELPLWGWKDPRNTLTLQAWLHYFPGAKVVHVIRNGVDCALSLHYRCHQEKAGAPECLDLFYCFDLWESYVNLGRRWKGVLGPRYAEIRYEDLIADPGHELSALEKRLSLGLSQFPPGLVPIRRYKDSNQWPVVGQEAVRLLIRRARRSELYRSLDSERGYEVSQGSEEKYVAYPAEFNRPSRSPMPRKSLPGPGR